MALQDHIPMLRTKICLTVLGLALFGMCYAQNITGPTTVVSGSTHTYTYSDGFLHLLQSWTITGGTEVSVWNDRLTYGVSVQWGSGSSGQVTFQPWGGSPVTLNVTITGGGGGTPACADTSLSNTNYVHTLIPLDSTSNTSTLENKYKIETVTYFDGLGRAEQSIAIRAGGNCEDIVTHIEYDQYGRTEKEYLPFAQANNGGTSMVNALSATTNFYNTTKYENTLNPFSEMEFESSPLNRVFKQAAPGHDWRMGGGNEIGMAYIVNATNEVRRYTVSLSFANNTYTPTLVLDTSNGTHYYPGELYKSVTKYENHDGTVSATAHTTEEFTNKEGQVVLKRTYGTSVVGGVTQTNVKHDTYYVYDDRGNLAFVLPPLMEAHSESLSTILLSMNGLGYQYVYDHRNRLVEKRLPGKDWEYIVYDNQDRPVLTQDANQRDESPDEWLFTKYDVFGRVIYTGTYGSDSLRTDLQATYDGKSKPDNYEDKLTSSGPLGIYYSNDDFPSTSIEVLTVNYYDNYTFDRAGGNSETSHSVTPTTNVRGLATGSRVKVLGTSDWITTVTYYDDKARTIYIYSKNDYLNTTDKVKSQLAFDGTVLQTDTEHARTGFSTITTEDDFEYDHMNRLKKHEQTIGGGTEVIAENTYDELGQLISKGQGGTAGQSRLQTVEYAYNVRGWLKNINNTGNLGDDLFAFKIKYTDTDNPSGVGLFNGNIAEVDWRTASDNTWFRYTYHYDALNRITKADFNGGSTGMGTRYRLSNVDYDKNGNIKALERNGHIVADPNRNTSSDFGPMDNLVYTYEARSNRLKKVLDNGSDGHGFKDGADVATEYTYDANGNMLRDLNKGISSNISYNHLNLPTQVTLSGGNIQYIYDATGVKQKKIVSTGTTTEYAGNFIYENGSLKMFSHLEGYVEPAAKAGTYNYAYQYRDHLGNIRLTYMDVNQNNPSAVSLEILEENNYYPFGLKHKGYNDVVSANVNSVARKFGFQEQELNDELGLNWHSYKFRNYDAAIGRFFNIDPLTEDYMDWGPYVFSGNRVIDARELEGLEPFFVNYDMTFKENVETNVNAYVEAGKSISKTAEFILNPVETVKGLWNLGKALLNPVDTAEAIVDNVSQTIEDTQSTDPDVAGPALGKIMAFTAETAAGFELGNISKISKVTTVADDLVSGIVKNADDVSAFASKNQIFSAQTGVDTSKIGEYLTQMRSGNFSSSSGAAGVIHNGKYILTEGNHRMNAAIRYGLETGDLKYAQQLIDNGNFQIRNPSDLGLSVNKFPVK